jgi:hypothetical protein
MKPAVSILIVLVLGTTVSALTPDLSSVRVAEALAERRGKEVAQGLLAEMLSSEIELIETADIIAVGEVLGTSEHWTADGAGRFLYPRKFHVSILVDRYVAGDCGDTLQFWQHHLDPSIDFAPSAERRTYDIKYAPGDTVVVLVYADCGATIYESNTGRSYRYLISGGVAGSKGIKLEQLVSEIAEVRDAERGDGPGASPN